MKMGSWVAGEFAGRAVVRLSGLALIVMLLMPRALAATHPPKAHAVVAKQKQSRAVESRRKSSKPKGKANKKAKRQKPVEADGDPVLMHRTKLRGKAVRPQAAMRRVVAVTPVAKAPRAAVEVSPSPAAEMIQTKKTVSADDFLRAAGGGTAELAAKIAPVAEVETFEHGESHPDDDERLPVGHKTAPVVTAMVSTAPEPVTPAGAKRATAKAPVMPLDRAGRDAVIEGAMSPMLLPTLYTRSGKLIVPPALKGTHEILVHQNQMADDAGLDRIQDDDDLARMRKERLLVALGSSASLTVNKELPENRRYARPWAAKFVADTAKNFYARFHQPLRLNSAVRTVAYQLRLQRVNGNAAGIDGENASPHLTGQAIDFGKKGMTLAQIAWMRAYLMPMMEAGKVDVEEEFQQACFHVSVYKAYLPVVKKKAAPKQQLAQLKRAEDAGER